MVRLARSDVAWLKMSAGDGVGTCFMQSGVGWGSARVIQFSQLVDSFSTSPRSAPDSRSLFCSASPVDPHGIRVRVVPVRLI